MNTTQGDERADRCAEAAPTGLRLELRGLKCPLPALRTARALATMPAGARLEVLADDPLAPLDLAHLCQTEGHCLEAQSPADGGGTAFTIRVGPI